MLKGGEFDGLKYEGVDEETTKQINTIIKNSISEPLATIANAIRERVPEMSRGRAARIAKTEVANAVEGSRQLLYKKEFGKDGTHTWQTAQDEDVRASHEDNNGVTVNIGKPFPNGNTRAGEDVNCRCTTIYNPPEDY